MEIRNRTRYSITIKNNGSYSVTAPNGEKHFLSTATKPSPKLYLVGLRGRLHYVGITNRPMSARINMGLKAKGKNGYYGYAWKKIRSSLTLDVLCCIGSRSARKELEAVEAEVAFLCRKNTGKWPLSQTEIHFRPPQSKHKKQAKEIYEAFNTANKSPHRARLQASRR